jgi:putative membrane-bound dehydrogenase-like protein
VSPDDAAATFEVEPGFQIELIAAEPLIADPVAMEIDENGNLYVVENHGYPLDKSRNSKVKLLRDTDGDGRMDKSTIFADSLMMPTGVMRWKNGIIVTDAPDVLYMEDTNDDGQADVIQRMLTGFALSNPQHNVNSPLLGLDNWIYIAHERTVGSEVYKGEFGDQGSEVHFPDRPEGVRLPQNANGRNVRIRPDTYELEMLASTTQYGHSFDVWGNHLLVNNSNHLMHSVLAAEYLNRNPDLVVSRSTSFPPDHGNAAEVFPITTTPDRQLLTDVGVMTSACGLVAYSGGAFPGAFNTNTTFVAEPVSNIVHADRLKANGSTFVASRVPEKKEFLASTDMWCRPVNLYIGPDGALYVVDYYREIIEHPEWLSDEVIQSGKLYNGADMGRIFRVSAVGSKKPSWTTELQLRHATDQELVEKLSEENIWWRRTAQRMLIDRRALKAVPNLIQMTTNARSAPGRLHALWTLEGLGQLKREQIENALEDTEAGVRVNAIKLAELHLDEIPGIEERLMNLQDDPDPKVRFQLLCTLGFVDSPEASEVRNKLLFRDIRDEFVQIAALSAPSSQADALLSSVIARYQRDIPAYGTLVENLAAMVAADKDSRNGYALLQNATRLIPGDSISWHVPALRGIARSFSMKSASLSSPQQKLLMEAFFEHEALPVRQACLQILQSAKRVDDTHMKRAMERARKIAGDSSASERVRALSINFLSLQNPERHADFLKQLIESGESIPIQLAAIRTLNAVPDETITEFTMQKWSTLDPAVQDAALNSFMDKEPRVRILLKALEDGKVQPTTVGWQRSIRLMTQRNIELRNRARAFFENDDQRKKVIEDYSAALNLRGDLAKGREVYQRSCAICHQVKGANGIAFGPDLGTIQGWPASGIMANILDPNQSIAHGFDLWNIGLKNGESFQGVITSETPSSLTVRNASGEVKTIARDELASQKALNMSAMPVGLESQITHQDMADLLAFLRDDK